MNLKSILCLGLVCSCAVLAGEALNNPDRGWYRTQGLRLKESGNAAASITQPLTHLRVDISAFSEKGVQSIDSSVTPRDTTFGKSIPLTDDALAALSATFENARQSGNHVVVRTSYDVDGRGKQDPPQEIILQHVKQLADIYGKNADVITYVELGMYGSWGEQHTSNNGSNAQIAEALQTMVANTPATIKVGVRRPDIVAYWLGVQSETKDGSGTVTNVGYENFDVNSSVFKAAAVAKGDTIYRVGMYNDGYLGSSSDLGTVGMGNPALTRDMMVRWLERYSMNTPYGGEMVANYNGDNPMNTARYLSYEGFRTHTSYLNWEWHYETIQDMKDSILGPEFGTGFRAPDSEYVGKTAYEYVEDHLGYRFVLHDANLPDTLYVNDPLKCRLKIQNLGFGNLTRTHDAKLIFTKQDTRDTVLLTDVDFRNVHSRTIAVDGADTTLAFDGVNEMEFEADAPSGEGSYDVSLMVDGIVFVNEDRSELPLGSFYRSTEMDPDGIVVRPAGNLEKGQVHVERADQKIQVRDGTNDKLYRVNGMKIK